MSQWVSSNFDRGAVSANRYGASLSRGWEPGHAERSERDGGKVLTEGRRELGQSIPRCYIGQVHSRSSSW